MLGRPAGCGWRARPRDRSGLAESAALQFGDPNRTRLLTHLERANRAPSESARRAPRTELARSCRGGSRRSAAALKLRSGRAPDAPIEDPRAYGDGLYACVVRLDRQPVSTPCYLRDRHCHFSTAPGLRDLSVRWRPPGLVARRRPQWRGGRAATVAAHPRVSP